MKKIGFVDYYISEWHANSYPAWIKAANEALGTDYEVAYAYAEIDKSPVDGATTDEWCAKYGAEKCDTIEELCEKSDVIMILAPTNPETHLRLAEKVLKFGKRTYIDKTFSPDYETAKKIFAIAKEHGTPFFSTSALRFASELDSYKDIKDIKSVVVTGTGSNFPEYIVHIVEMLVKIFPQVPEKLMVEKTGLTNECTLLYKGGEKAKLIFSPHYPYTVYADNGETGLQSAIASDFFPVLLKDIVNFFETGNISFDTNQTLYCMKIRGALIEASEKVGSWVEL